MSPAGAGGGPHPPQQRAQQHEGVVEGEGSEGAAWCAEAGGLGGRGRGNDAETRAREDYKRMVENGNLVARAPIPAASVRNLTDLIGVKKRLAARFARS